MLGRLSRPQSQRNHMSHSDREYNMFKFLADIRDPEERALFRREFGLVGYNEYRSRRAKAPRKSKPVPPAVTEPGGGNLFIDFGINVTLDDGGEDAPSAPRETE